MVHLKLIAAHLMAGLLILILLLLVNKHIYHLQEVLIHNIHPMHRRSIRVLMVIKAIYLVFQQVTLVNILQQVVNSPLRRVNFQDNMDNIHHPLVPRRRVNILQGLPRQDNILLQQDNIFHLQDNILGSLQQEITLIQDCLSRNQFSQVLTLSLLNRLINLGIILLPHWDLQLQNNLYGT
jgi:hypothetical protein